MRFQSVGLALSVGMALLVVLLGFTLLSAAGLVGFAADEATAVKDRISAPVADRDSAATAADSLAARPARSAAEVAEIAAGDALFKGNCAQCHAVNDVVVGPALGGISRRRPLAWLLPWVKNSGKVVASGDEYAVALYTKFQKQQMPSFALSDQEIKAIVAYISSEEGRAGAVAAR